MTSTTGAKDPLPRLMVAPNGARRGRPDHPALPLTDAELVETAINCQQAGADGIHIHIRDDDTLHLLDAGRYLALLSRLEDAVPGLYLQVTSEAAGRYDTNTQQEMVRALRPRHVSVALREMVRTPDDWLKATDFYSWAEDSNVDIQHIVYSTDELQHFLQACSTGQIPGEHHLIQLVLGTYDGRQISRPEDIKGFTDLMDASGLSIDWGLCAFGKEETACLVETARCGGKARVGFENSLWHADGTMSKDNAARVREVQAGIGGLS
ncbi:MAG: 3-keto-5-aminohexanoate cleavage protein [Litoreibacter sp.]